MNNVQLKRWRYDDTQTIDDTGTSEFNSFQAHDRYNNYTFTVSRTRGTTFISPYNKDASQIELKVGVLLPFHQNNNGWTRVMTMRYSKKKRP